MSKTNTNQDPTINPDEIKGIDPTPKKKSKKRFIAPVLSLLITCAFVGSTAYFYFNPITADAETAGKAVTQTTKAKKSTTASTVSTTSESNDDNENKEAGESSELDNTIESDNTSSESNALSSSTQSNASNSVGSSSNAGSASGSNYSSGTTTNNAPSNNSSSSNNVTQAHTHNWQPVYTQVWESNIVTIYDYETHTFCKCGLDCGKINEAWVVHCKANNNDFAHINCYRDRVIIGSHTEDQGSYVNQITSYSCSCGAVA